MRGDDEVEKQTRHKRSAIRIVGDYAEVQLNGGLWTKIDLDDIERVAGYVWRNNGVGYACTKRNKKVIYLHRFLLDAPDDARVDHISGDPLDNRRSNLRLANRAENQWNERRLRKTNKSG